MRQELGKIQKVSFGHGGYQDACVGISFTLGGEDWGVCDFWGYWATKWTPSCRWTEADREKDLGKTVLRIHALLNDAKVDSIDRLKGVPVRVFFNGNSLASWEVLKEVL